MKLNQVEVGKKIEIILLIDGKKLTFNSVVRAIVDESILIDPIREDEKTVGFAGYEAMAISIIEDSRPYIWSGINIRLVRYNDDVYHQLQTEQAGAHFNRRKFYRQYVGVEGMVNDLSNSFNVTVKDVSGKGCSFVSDQEFSMGQSVVVSFTIQEKNFVLRAIIVRSLQVEGSSRCVYGCEMRLENKEIEKFVSERQRQDMQRRNASASDRNNR